MTTSPDLGLPFVAQQQAQPEVTHNEALVMIQALLMGAVSSGTTTPPGSPTEGDVYVLGTSPTGAWSGYGKHVAVYTSGGWRFVPGRNSAGTIISMGTRHKGMRVATQAGGEVYFDGTNWQDAAYSPTSVTSYVSGIVTGCEFSVSYGGTTFTIAAGTLRFVDDYTTPGAPVITSVSYAGGTPTDSYPSSVSTFVGINSSGTVVQQTDPFTPDQMRTICPIAHLIKISGLIQVACQISLTSYNASWAAHDLMSYLGPVVNGCQFYGNSGLTLGQTAGTMFRRGADYPAHKITPSDVNLSAVATVSFHPISRNSSNTVFSIGSAGSTLNPAVYDNGGASTAGIPTATLLTNSWQCIRIYMSSTGGTFLQYGPAAYTSLALAKAGYFQEAYYPSPAAQALALRGVLFVRGGAAALNNTSDAVFIPASKIGDVFVT